MEERRMRKVCPVILISLFYVIILSGAANALRLPDTGQSVCYNGAMATVSCSGTGQDGEYNINQMSFTDNGNGAVTDNNTGLMWQKSDSGVVYSASGGAAYCEDLNLGNHSDWRLPTKKELITIVNYGFQSSGAAIDSVFTGTMPSNYWSSSEYLSSLGYTWYVAFNDGYVSADISTAGAYVRCVRGGNVSPTLNDNGDGTVTDIRTGLVWQKEEAGAMNWNNALTYCEDLTLANSNDWRLPNIKEMESLTDDNRIGLTINATYFPNAFPLLYWSSTSYNGYPTYAWVAGFSNGGVYYFDNKAYEGNLVRCVRSRTSCSDNPVIISGVSGAYATVQGAYEAAATGRTILMRQEIFVEDLVFDNNKSVTLKGGYNCGFTARSGYGVIRGALTVGGAALVTLDKIMIK